MYIPIAKGIVRGRLLTCNRLQILVGRYLQLLRQLGTQVFKSFHSLVHLGVTILSGITIPVVHISKRARVLIDVVPRRLALEPRWPRRSP